MYEIRVGIPSEKLFRDLVEKKKGEKLRSFKFKDSYFIPQDASKKWKDGFFTMRLRNTNESHSLYFTKYKLIEIQKLPIIKNATVQKIPILQNQPTSVIYTFLDALNFQKSICIERNWGEVWQIKLNEMNHIELTFENISHLGFSSEIELQQDDIKNERKMIEIKSLLHEFNAIFFRKPIFGSYMDNSSN